MKRPDANRIAIRAARAILDAAHDWTFDVRGRAVHVGAEPIAAPDWPRPIAGLDHEADGPWPTPVHLSATWEGGSAELRMSLSFWPATEGKYADHLGLRFTVPSTGQEILWVTVTKAIDDREDGDRAQLVAWAHLIKRQTDQDVSVLSAALRGVVADAGLPFTTRFQVAVFQVQVPSGEVHPAPGEAFERLATLALLKLPFQLRGDQPGLVGAPPFDLAPTAPLPPEAAPHRRAAMLPLPGGVRRYQSTLDDILAWAAEEPRSQADLEDLLQERYEALSDKTRTSYRAQLLATDLIRQTGDVLELTELGERYRDAPTPDRLFRILAERFIGVLEALVIAEVAPTDTQCTRALLNDLLGVAWATTSQPSYRRNWLLSMGLTQRTPDGDHLTDAGARVLQGWSDEADVIRAELEERLRQGDSAPPPLDEPELDDDPTPPPTLDAANWFADRIELDLDSLNQQLGDLRLPASTLAQAAAALTAGKHLLLVGPPGTGKTELAAALAQTARIDGYCSGLFTATAHADWTTFDTIGGYAIQAHGALAFRSGVFLAALERRQWLLIDELNRADIDRSFGELMTVLAGRGTDTAFERDGAPIAIGPEPHCSHRVPPTFRVIATMNTWDKTSLFRLSFAVQRRFAILHVGVPEPEVYAAVLDKAAHRGVAPPLTGAELERVKRLFSPKGVLPVRDIGPAVALDVVRYVRVRGQGARGLAEAIPMFLLAQLEGLGSQDAHRAWLAIHEALADQAPDAAIASVRERFAELFPELGDPA